MTLVDTLSIKLSVELTHKSPGEKQAGTGLRPAPIREGRNFRHRSDPFPAAALAALHWCDYNCPPHATAITVADASFNQPRHPPSWNVILVSEVQCVYADRITELLRDKDLGSAPVYIDSVNDQEGPLHEGW